VAREANRHASQWAFAKLQGFIAYKAACQEASASKWMPTENGQGAPVL
jgi:hypothetical protein